MSCSKCNCKVDRKNANVICSVCKQIFHTNCVSINDIDLEFMKVTKMAWKCDGCVTVSKIDRDNVLCGSSTVTASSGILEMIELQLRDIKAKSIEFNDNVTNRLNSLQSAIERLETLTAENILLKSEIKTMQAKINVLEQSQHDSAIEIRGVPFSKGEDIYQVVCDVLNKGFSMQVKLDDIDFSYRKKSRGQGNSIQPGVIYAKFTRKRVKNSILLAKKTSKCNTIALGLPASCKIFLNESLSYHNRCLLYEAKLVKTTKNYEYLWVKNGIIYMRKVEGSELIKITCESDLEHL